MKINEITEGVWSDFKRGFSDGIKDKKDAIGAIKLHDPILIGKTEEEQYALRHALMRRIQQNDLNNMTFAELCFWVEVNHANLEILNNNLAKFSRLVNNFNLDQHIAMSQILRQYGLQHLMETT